MPLLLALERPLRVGDLGDVIMDGDTARAVETTYAEDPLSKSDSVVSFLLEGDEDLRL